MDDIKYYLITRKIVKHECKCCHQLPVWNNTPLYLMVDHINNKIFDCTLGNLRLLCPNCLSQKKGKKHFKTEAGIQSRQQCQSCQDLFKKVK